MDTAHLGVSILIFQYNLIEKHIVENVLKSMAMLGLNFFNATTSMPVEAKEGKDSGNHGDDDVEEMSALSLSAEGRFC